LVLLFGAIGLVLWFRRRGSATAEGLSADEEKRLAALMDENTVSGETEQ
jgi:cytochrome c-type biogenesis protein CcmH/NrfF